MRCKIIHKHNKTNKGKILYIKMSSCKAKGWHRWKESTNVIIYNFPTYFIFKSIFTLKISDYQDVQQDRSLSRSKKDKSCRKQKLKQVYETSAGLANQRIMRNVFVQYISHRHTAENFAYFSIWQINLKKKLRKAFL